MLACLRIALLALCLSTAQAQPVQLRVAYEDKDTPDHAGASTVVPEHPGILVEMIGQLEQRIPNLLVTYSRKPWARCLAELEAGNADAVFASSVSPERMKIGVFPMRDGKADRQYRIDTKAYNLYKLKDTALDWDGKRFLHQRGKIGAMRGYAIVAELQKMGVAVSEVDRQENAFRMLLLGRLDGFAQLSAEGDYMRNNNPEFAGIVKVAQPIMVKDYYLQISHQFHAANPKLAQEIWKTLAAIRQAESERLTLKYMKAYAD
ncbi:substrate-binding periplasmic protein [Janthinobacterium fluminis]|uniref:Transporter substrate-binding domain-containing protein n=1 Tax=Janthinobacterium fluminis TaxID=2987524 RepID=A0ABT5K822_9BURK|nr:transporter substrate-binding domain-containing protein [Janthinobacterium fluminis]MDC8760573.1 transporter substrate-binding domain-containing protein [Janthinobacterium fluminis]